MRAIRVGILVLGMLHALSSVAESADDLEGSAYIDEGPTREWIENQQAQLEAAQAYVDCLKSAEAGNWFGKTDFTPCDEAREIYASYLVDDITDDVLGCLEVGTVGAARSADRPCERLRERFADSYAEFGGAR